MSLNQLRDVLNNPTLQSKFVSLLKDQKFQQSLKKASLIFNPTLNGYVIQSKEDYNFHVKSGCYVSKDFKEVKMDGRITTRLIAEELLRHLKT